MFQAYLQHYGDERRELMDVERTATVELNSKHTLAFKMDLVFRGPNGLEFLDYKTEKRGGQNNSSESWAARSQVSLYQWAASKFYNEPVQAIWLDVVTRGSPKGQEGPSFRRERLIRTQAQQAKAVETICWVADQIEVMQSTGFWPQNTENCRDGWKRCDYFALCHLGRTDGNLKLYTAAVAYLDL